MLGNVFDALAVDPDLPAVVEAIEKLLSGVRKRRGHVYGLSCEAEVPALRDCFVALLLAMTKVVIASGAKQSR
jgi:hypothetical protein